MPGNEGVKDDRRWRARLRARLQFGTVLRRADARGAPPDPATASASIDALQLPLGILHRGLGILRAGAIIGEHVDHDEVGDRGRRLLAGRADAGGRQRTLRGLPEHGVLRIGRPDGRGVIGVERMGQVTPRARQPLLEILLLQHERDEGFRGVWIFAEVEGENGHCKLQFEVRYNSPARNALLLEESFQDATPEMKVADNSLAYSSAFAVSGELMMTLSSLSTVQPL